METDERTLPSVIDEASSVLSKYVVPVYEDDVRGRPSLHGSGFFVKCGGHHFLVSAAHVLETLRTKSLSFYIAPGVTCRLSGTALLTPWDGDREKDPIDVGVLKLSAQGLPPYPAIDKHAMDISCLRPSFLPRSGKDYLVVGYPASQSQVNPVARGVTATPCAYRNQSIEEDAYSSHGLDTATHLVLPLDLRVGLDANGKHRNIPKPQGMSGSPIWMLYDDEGRDETPVFQVVAVGTKYRKRQGVLIGTDIRVAVDMINDAG